MPEPIFLLSVPRAGSTMTQKILASHEEISTAAEPWVLLPYLYALRDRGVYAEYSHELAQRAMKDFIELLPGRRQRYISEMRSFMLQLYGLASGGDFRYFLDKTPRYHLIVDDLMELFPDGKFIFLWRDPLAVVASVMETWAGGRWNLHLFKVDLYTGLENLIDAYQRYREKVYAVKYEDLVTRPEEEWEKLFGYLDLPFYSSILEHFGDVKLLGGMGDSSVKVHYQLSQKSLEKWRQTLNNPIRKAWCRRYLNWIGPERLELMGYRYEDLLSKLDSVPSSGRWIGSDVLRVGYGLAYQFLEPARFKHKIQLLPDWHRVHAHR